MGMFDKEHQLTKAVEDGNVPPEFRVDTAQYLGKVESADYGANDKARLAVSDPNGGAIGSFVVFGVMAQQIERMEDGDLPATCRIGRDGRANVLEPVES